MNTKTLLGLRIRRYRESRGWSRREMAELLPGFTESRLGNYEQGLREPDLDTLAAIAKVLDVGMMDLISDQPRQDDEILVSKLYRMVPTTERPTVLRILQALVPNTAP